MSERERKHPEAKCETCPLYDNVAVPSHWKSSNPKVVYVGEAPGYTERRVGKPFVGNSGMLLDLTLAEHGADSSDAMLTNTVLCHPPGNENPPQDAIDCCAPRLEAELAEAKPEFVVALGKTAAQRIMGENLAITKARIGPPRHIKGKPYKVVLSIHPAACLRNTNLFDMFYTDIGKVVSPIKVEWRPPKYKVFNDVTQARAALAQIRAMSNERLVMDIETPYEKDDAFEHPRNLLCIGLGYMPGKVIVLGRDALASPLVLSDLDTLLREKQVVCHNAKFDLGTLHRMGIGTYSVGFDTMLASYALDETAGRHGLKELAQDYLGAPRWEETVKRQGFEEADPDELHLYNAIDVAATWDLMDWQLEKMDEDDHKVHRMLCEWSDRIMLVESEGVYIDLEALSELEVSMQARIEELYEKMQQYRPSLLKLEQGGPAQKDAARLIDKNDEELNPNSVQQVKGVLNYLTGATLTTTDADMLDILTKHKNPTAAAMATDMLEWRSVNKLYGTYVKGTRRRLGEDGRIRTTFKLIGTETGRLSSANPNVQNVPRQGGIREIYAAEPGNVIVYPDYGNIEGRIVATLARSESMRAVLSDPERDIHSELAAMIFGDDFTKEQRVGAKTVVHGKNYARTAEGIASDPSLGLSIKDATKISNAYDKMFPEVIEWQASIRHTVLNTDEVLVTPFGRKRRFSLITNATQEDVYKEALAFQPQSIGSDICMNAAIRLFDLGIKTRIFIHDGIVIECKEDEAEDVAKTAKEVMERTAVELFTDYVPFPVDIEIGRSWGEVD